MKRLLLLAATAALAAAAARARDGAGGWVVDLPAGDIVVTRALEIGAADSGSVFRGAADGSTRISGGVAIKGWTDRGDGVWGAPLPRDGLGRPLFTETLFVNGRRAQRSRFPADGGFFRAAETTLLFGGLRAARSNVPDEDGSFPIAIDPRSLRNATCSMVLDLDEGSGAAKILAATPKDELASAQLLAHVDWDVARLPIAGFDGGRLSVDAAGTGVSKRPWSPKDFYALENVRAAFTEKGQWFYDAKAGEILYRPLDGERIDEAVAPRDGLETLLSVRAATNVVFENVTFAYSAPTRSRGPTRLAPHQAAATVSAAAVVVDDSSGVEFRDCRFERLGSYALWFRDGCRGGGARRCEMTDLGAGGVRIGGFGFRRESLKERPADCTNDVPYVETAPWMTSGVAVEDCLVAHGGRFHPAGVGILLTHASDCTLAHNEILDLYYTGISVGWTWGYAGSPSQRNTVAFNHVRDIGQGRLADMGGIYTLGASFGTRVANNVVHGVRTCSYGGCGLYADEGSEGIVFENNLVYDTDDESFNQHYGKDNVLRNNILAGTGPGRISVGRAEAHRSLVAERNIVVWTEGDAFGEDEGAQGDGAKASGTKSEKARIDWRGNLWWRADGRESFNGTPFDEWRGRVGDEGSVFADPLFADRESGDFALGADSPALRLGFVPFDPSLAGRRPSAAP